ncbi:transmembrane protein 100-like [Conger conger]|uniref:transmembrane protein 100-like n=1 Tax=Conger conger TaxID=82655 RepID=UPI002A5989BD|nr:transmembrane protein 100-like [Conger conger]
MTEQREGDDVKAPGVPPAAAPDEEKTPTRGGDGGVAGGDGRAVTIATSPLVRDVQLTAATGGADLSCYRCTVPFGVVVLIAGVVVTGVAYAFNTHGSTISVLGLVLLSAGLLLLAASVACWKLRRERQRRERRRESQAALVATRGTAFV